MKETAEKKTGVTGRMWLILILIGLAGQFAWSIENMYLNTYITYLNFNAPNGQGFDFNLMIALTTALSAIVATLTTLFMGAYIDKVRKRKLFISIGYILWGIATACFGILNVDSDKSFLKLNVAPKTAAILVIVIDCIMTFFGSTSNDAGFNSFVTKNVSKNDKSKVEGVLSVLPLISMLIIFVGLNGLTTDSMDNRWDLFFYIVGGIVLLVGIVSLFLLPKEKKEERSKEPFLPSLLYGFRKTTIIENPKLYLVLLIYFVFAVSQQIFFPYLMVYIGRSCDIKNSGDGLLTPFAIVMAIALLVGSLLSVLIGFLADKKGKEKMIVPTLAIFFIGTLSMMFIPFIENDIVRLVYCIITTLLMILGFVSVPTIINAMVREYIPEGKEGEYMGVRMIFVVALPMCIGPFIGSALNKAFGQIYTGAYGVKDNLPSHWGYLISALVLLLAIIPYLLLRKEMKKDERKRPEESR